MSNCYLCDDCGENVYDTSLGGCMCIEKDGVVSKIVVPDNYVGELKDLCFMYWRSLDDEGRYG